MRSNGSARLALAACLMITGPALAQDGPPQSSGPQATSDRSADRYDEVGYATVTASGASLHATLPQGSYVEVTSLDTGRTVLVQVGNRGWAGGRAIIALSPLAAQAIGANGRVAVRVRRVTPTAADQMALKRGEAASPRLDAPASLLAGLRAKLTPAPVAVAPPPLAFAKSPPATPRTPAVAVAPAAPVARGSYYVQVGTFSSKDRAAALAKSLGGNVSPFAKLWRVRTGPFADVKSAARARDAAAARGYGDARVVHED